MIKITEQLWVGNSKDAEHEDLRMPGINAVLNVAHDLQGKRGWSDGLLYNQVGLIDGPGNRAAAYHAAVLTLAALVADQRKILVFDHGMGRALAVALMYLNMTDRRGWDGWLSIIRERAGDVQEPHAEHRRAFDKINWRLIASVLEG